MSLPESWEPRVGDRVVYRGSRTDWRGTVATVTDLKVICGTPSVMLRLDDDRRVTTVRQTLRPVERSIDPATSGGAS